MAWTYNPTAIPVLTKDVVRLLLGDTISTAPVFQDEELNQFLLLRPSVYGAAALACQAAAAKYSALVSESAGDRRIDYSDRAKAYRAAAAEYKIMASVAGGGVPYAGGISVSDKLLDRQNEDSVQPQFEIGMDDNPFPVGPVGPLSEDQGGETL